MTRVLFCGCDHPVQDSIYGFQNRVFNWAVKKALWRCSACAKEKSDGTTVVKPKKK